MINHSETFYKRQRICRKFYTKLELSGIVSEYRLEQYFNIFQNICIFFIFIGYGICVF